jgi:transposase InsO family protein
MELNLGMPHLISFVLEHGVDQQFSVPRMPQQNGFMERNNRTLVEMASTILDKHRTPRCFWAEAINTACYISNRIFLHSLLNLTPFGLHFGCQLSLVANALS